jgi:predicted alpha/beta hydrolase family esterase
MPTLSPNTAPIQILTVCDRADPPPFWVRRLAAVIPSYSHVELAPAAPERRNLWAARLDEAVRGAGHPVLLIASGISCFAAAWWARLSPACYLERVAGAVLVRPLGERVSQASPDLGSFASPNTRFPFPTVVVDDRLDNARCAARARRLARSWATGFLDLAAPDLRALVAEEHAGNFREQLVLALLDAVTVAQPAPLRPLHAAAAALPASA